MVTFLQSLEDNAFFTCRISALQSPPLGFYRKPSQTAQAETPPPILSNVVQMVNPNI
jgi:hypothetical protein